MKNEYQDYPSSTYRFFIVDRDEREYYFFDSAEARDNYIPIVLETYKDDNNCWMEENIEYLMIGELTHFVKQTNVKMIVPVGEVDDEGFDENGDYYNPDIKFTCDYHAVKIDAIPGANHVQIL